jgi:hypothetical protein
MRINAFTIIRVVAGLIWMVLAAATLAAIAEGDAPGRLRIDLRDNELNIEADGVPLGDVIDVITEHLAIDFEGLQADRRRPVAFSLTARSSETLVRKLLRYLGARNYVCEYIQDRLVKVIVFPTAGSPTMPAKRSGASDTAERLTVIEVVDVIEETQAEALGLKAGDIILKYDGTRVSTYDDLIEESTKDHGTRMIEMILLRKERLVSVFLEGGYIGVRIRAKRIAASAVPTDLY